LQSLPPQVSTLGDLDSAWVGAYESACAALPGNRAAAASAENQTATTQQLTNEHVTQYLRRKFPTSPQVTATQLLQIPGGRSKKTYFVSVSGSDVLPRELVIRQDYALKYAGTKVAAEHRPLLALSALGLPVPRPVHFESEESELGPPFLLMDRLPGKPPGSYFGMAMTCPGAFLDLAKILGKLHSSSPQSLGITQTSHDGDQLRAMAQNFQQRWREHTTCASPVVEYGYAWAFRECEKARGSICVVHGDCGPHNLLVENDRLTALLDWEFSHIGDPAEDLGTARVYSEASLPWPNFMAAYTAAGGPGVPESRIRLGMLLNYLKGTALVAASGRNFADGGTTEFIKGASSYTGLRLIEQRLAQLLMRFRSA
jgi:aminoglycoside phosphotransferase (APT) family kinase protein